MFIICLFINVSAKLIITFKEKFVHLNPKI